MKTRIAILLVILSGVASVFSQAQNAAGGAPPAGGAQAAEVIPALTFGEEMSLSKIIGDLSLNAGTNIVIDPSLVLPTNMPSKLKFENITALNALKSIIKNNGLVLEGDPETGVGRVTKKSAIEPWISDTFILSWANPTNVADAIKGTFKDNKATAIPDGRTGTLAVGAIQREFDAITNMVMRMDKRVQQILISTKMLQTSQNPRSSKGIDWAGTLAGQGISAGNGFLKNSTTISSPGAPATTTTTLPGGRVLTGTSAAGGSSTISTLQSLLDGQANLPGVAYSSAQAFTPGVAFLSADGARVVLSFLNQDADTEVVSTPQTVTMDNEPTTLQVTRALPIFKFTPGSANVASGTDVTYTNLGTILQVTPHIRGGTDVEMKVTPEVSSLDGQNTQVVGGQNNQANVYSVARIETKVVVPSGSTLVMGGLISDRKTKETTSVPFFGKIPVLGSLFKHDSKTQLKENLMIFITPTIVKQSDFQPTTTDFLQTPLNPPIEQKLDKETKAK